MVGLDDPFNIFHKLEKDQVSINIKDKPWYED